MNGRVEEWLQTGSSKVFFICTQKQKSTPSRNKSRKEAKSKEAIMYPANRTAHKRQK